MFFSFFLILFFFVHSFIFPYRVLFLVCHGLKIYFSFSLKLLLEIKHLWIIFDLLGLGIIWGALLCHKRLGVGQ